MLQCAIPNTANVTGFLPATAKPNPIQALYRALLTCELIKLEKAIHEYQHDLNGLLNLIEMLGRMLNSRELVVTAKKFSWRRGSTIKWGVVCEFRLIRAHRILMIPTEPDFPSVVLEHLPGTSGTKSCDAPELLMRQIGKIAGLPICFAPPPPLAFVVQ